MHMYICSYVYMYMYTCCYMYFVTRWYVFFYDGDLLTFEEQVPTVQTGESTEGIMHYMYGATLHYLMHQ